MGIAPALLGVLAWLVPEPQDSQAEFARETLAAVAAGDDELLRALAREFPQRARLLAHELLWETLRAGPGDERALAAARRVVQALASASLEAGNAQAAATLGIVEGLDPEQRARQRELDRAFFAATDALARGERRAAEADARAAAEHAAAIGLPYLELRARRLLAEALRDDATRFRAPLLRALELGTMLGLWPEACADLETLGQLDLQEGRLHEARAHLEEAERLALRTGDGERAMLLALQRGSVLANLGLLEDAHAILSGALAHFEARGRAPECARAATLLGELAGGAGRHEEALRRFADAARNLRLAGDLRGEVRATIQLAGVHSELGLVADAEQALARARVLVDEHGLAAELRQWVLARGLVQLDAGQAEEALATLGSLERAAGSEALFAEARRHIGTALLALGRTDEAEQAFRLALGAWSADPLKNSWARTGLGDALHQRGELAEAEREYGRALEEAGRVASLEGAWRAELGLGRCAEARGRGEQALRHYALAIDAVEALRTQLAAPVLRAHWLGNKLELYHRSARLLARAGRLAEAYRMAEAAQARTLLELSAARTLARDAQPGERDEDRYSLAREHLGEAESRLRLLQSQLDALPCSPASKATRAELAQRLRGVRAEHEAARLELQLADPRAAVLRGLADAPALAATQQALGEDERLLHYLVGPAGVALFVVGPRAARFLELDSSAAEIDGLVQRILRPIGDLRARRLDLATLGFDARAALELHRILLGSAETELAGCRKLWVIPDGPLRQLPFALLVSRREKLPVDPARLFAQYGGCRFLIEDRALAYLPSAGLLRPATPLRAPERELLVVADPLPAPPGAARLGWSPAEARALAAGRAEPAVRLCLGEAAGEGRVKAALPGTRVLHLATHGLLDDRQPAFSRLALAPGEGEDGWLHAHEVEDLDLCAERVVLSACETLGHAGRGEGLLGLTRAFLQAGARSVVASAWAVDDQATAELMLHYQAALESGEEPVAALRSAQVALLRGPGRHGLLYLHPCFWAGFLHVGAR